MNPCLLVSLILYLLSAILATSIIWIFLGNADEKARKNKFAFFFYRIFLIICGIFWLPILVVMLIFGLLEKFSSRLFQKKIKEVNHA